MFAVVAEFGDDFHSIAWKARVGRASALPHVDNACIGTLQVADR